MNKTLKKIIATVLLTCMISANLSIIGEYGISYALSESELSNQKTTTQNENVEFNSYFEGGVHSKTEKLENTTKLFVNIKVKNAGYLENPVISFSDVNFKIAGEVNNENIQSISENKITLNKLNNGTDLTLEIPVKVLNEDEVALDNFEKETKTNFTATYIDANGKSNEISKQVVNKLLWDGTEGTEGILETDVTKKIPYHIDGKYGVLLQFYINSGIKDNKLPIKTTKIDVTVPTLNNIKPTSANVIATSTQATNGEINGADFTSSNYNYDSTTGVLTINTKNKQDKISWVKNVKDRYLVTFIFDVKEAYDYVVDNTNKIEVGISAKSEIEVYNGQKTIVKNNAEKSFSYTAGEGATVSMPTEGKMIDFDIKTISEMSKGQIYANYEATNKKETTYNVKYYATVCNTDLTDKIEFTQDVDQFLTEENTKNATTVAGNNYAYNKTVKINIDIFQKILGETGSIKLTNLDGTEVATINKDTTVSDGNYTIDISNKNNNQLLITTSKPVEAGILEIEIEKAVKTNIDYTSNQIKNFKKLTTGITAKVNAEKVNQTKEITLTEPKTEVLLGISQKELTTVVENKDIDLRIMLNTSDVTKALYKNPTFKIKLPSYIEKCNLNSYDIVMGDGLKIKSAKTVTENGQIVINIELEGTQTEYATNAQYKGPIIALMTNMTTNPLTPTNNNKIKVEYTNANEFDTQTNKVVEQTIKFIAPEGIVTSNKIENYVENGSLQTISSEKAEVKLNAYAEAKTITISGKVINNYPNKINNVVILGRIPAKNTTVIDNTQSLDATFDSKLLSEIKIKGIDTTKYTVYYSNNGAANKDITNSENGWNTEFKEDSKSYLIIINNYEMQTGETFDFKYNVKIPNNIAHNNQASEMYKIYYNNISTIGTQAESKVSSIIKMTTGEGVVLKTKLEPTVDVIRTGQIVKMKATVTNTGDLTAQNAKLNIELPKYTKFVDYEVGDGFTESNDSIKTIELGTIKSGESKVVYYNIKIDEYIVTNVDYSIEQLQEEYEQYLQQVKKILDQKSIDFTEEEQELLDKSDYYENKFKEYKELTSFPKTIENIAYVIVDSVTEKIIAEELKISVYEGNFSIQLLGDMNENEVKKKGEELTFRLELKKISGELFENTNVKLVLPKGMKYKSAITKNALNDATGIESDVTYNEEENVVNINVGDLGDSKIIIFKTEILDYEGEAKIYVTAKADKVEENYSNALIYNTEKINLKVTELTTNSKQVKEGENIVYTFEIENKGKSPINNIKITDKLPEELEFVSAKYMIENNEYLITNLTNGSIEVRINSLYIGEKKSITITTTAKLLKDNQEKKINNSAVITADGMEAIETNTVTNVIEYNKELRNQINPSDDTKTAETYKITGTAWLDSNKNGIRDDQEELLSGIKAILVNKSTNVIVKDKDTKQEKSTITNEQGQYEFDNIEPGKYFVLFVYDSAKYSITEYQKAEVDTSVNSDAIDIEVLLNGEKIIAGITDTIIVADSNVRDIDIGLYVQEKFDLRLDKYISKITRTTPTSGTEIFEYENKNLAKIEILKNNLGKSSIVIEYKIVVKNEGAVAGYAKKIVDYLPKGVVFNTELNKDWYLSDNGNVYNTSLENTIIRPGETKELTLVLVKQITEDSIGVLNNTAEIYEVYNEQGLKDIDSTPANKVETEDDMSKADIVLGIVTGTQIAIYIILPLVVISLLGFGIFEIKKRVLKK